MNEENNMKTAYICTLPAEMQEEIKAKLVDNGLSGEDLETAMNSRLCDLEDTIKEEKK